MPDTGENTNTNTNINPNVQLSADLLGLNGQAAFIAATDYMQVGSLVQSLAVQFGVGVAAGYLTMEFGIPTQAAIGVAMAYGASAVYDYLTGGGYAGPTTALGGYGYPGPNFDFSNAVVDPVTGQIQGFY